MNLQCGKRFRSIALALGLLATAIWPSDDRVHGFSFFSLDGVNVTWPGGQAVRYLSPSTFPPGSEIELFYLASMGLWNLVPASEFEYYYATNAEDFPIDNFDGYSDTAAVPAEEIGPGVLGVSILVNDGASWFDVDQLYADLPEGVGWHFEANPDCAITTEPLVYGFSFLLVATHELGHALGLGHDPFGDEAPGTPFLVQTMNPRYPSGGTLGLGHIVELHTEDQAGTRFLYPHSGPSEPPHQDLANAAYSFSSTQVGKAIPVFFTPTAVHPGETLTVRTVLENLGTTNLFNVRLAYYLSSDATIETSDQRIADVRFDVAFQDALDFDAAIDLPADLPAGTYHVGSIIDDLNEFSEVYEDNNAVHYCEALTVGQLAPVINAFGQVNHPCGQPFSGPTPSVTHPLNMTPIQWSLDNPEPGMTIDPATGVISWPQPVRSDFLYTVYVRATNAAGSTTQVLFVGVHGEAPQLVPMDDALAICGQPFEGAFPALTDPACMAPVISWSLDERPMGMQIDLATGQVHWPDPFRAGAPHPVVIRATNAQGSEVVAFTVQVAGSADSDGDGHVDLLDFADFAACQVGPDASVDHPCACRDLDADGDVDLSDLALLQIAFTGRPLGGCCDPNGTCATLDEQACTQGGGTFLGAGAACGVDTCTGACCLSNGFCLRLSEADCTGADGTYAGPGGSCLNTFCPPD